jgi:polyphosphate kinase
MQGRDLRGGIIMKLNNLQEKEMISKLYEASRAGVKIQLIVRRICCLGPGLDKQSENIKVHRIVDRYLEHARVFVFHNNGEAKYFMGSADWMNRNLHSRIEVVFPVYEKELSTELEHILQLQLNDDSKAVLLTAELENKRIQAGSGASALAAQESIYNYVKSLHQ